MAHTPAELKKLIEDAEREKCVTFLLECWPMERDEAWPTVKALIPWVIAEYKGGIFDSSENKRANRRRAIERAQVLGLAVLATGLLPDMRKLPWYCDPFDQPELLIKLLRGVEVPWLGSWIDFLAENRKHARYQCLIDAGFCTPPNDDNYVIGFLHWSHRNRLESGIIDKNFLEVVAWLFFEVEGGGDRSLSAADKYSRQEEHTWAYALKKLSEDGRLSRARLLDASLEALSRDFAQFRAGWFSQFHEYMETTLEERIERTERYLKLLASTIPPTVSFALAALKLIDQAGKVSVELLSQHLSPALLSKNKGTVLAALALLEGAAAKKPAKRPALLRLAIEALVSETVQVQERIIKLLLKYADDLDAGGKNRLVELSEMVSSSNRKKIEPLLPSQRPVSKKSKAEPEVARVTLSPIDDSFLIKPIEGVEELIERASYILENPNDVAETERVLDALVRFSQVDRDTLGKTGQPLLKRTAKIYEARSTGWVSFEDQVLAMTALLIWNWFDAAAPQSVEAKEPRFETLRLNGILEQVRQKSSLPLLSTPTHAGFWLDPGVLVQRLLAWQKVKVEPDPYDTVVALLRLAPEQQKKALQAAAKLSGEIGAAVRYALGGEEKIGSTIDLWIAASRSRYGGGEDAALAKKHPHLGAGAIGVPEIHWKITSQSGTGRTGPGTVVTWTNYYLKVDPIPEMPKAPPATWLTVLLYNISYYSRNGWGRCPGRRIYLWYASFWPAWREHLYLQGTLILGNSTRSIEVEEQKAFVLLELMSDPRERFERHALSLLNFGLSCPHADGRAAAVHAFISGIDSGRLEAKALGESMREFFTTRLMHPARVRKSLDEVVRVSARQKRAVLVYLEALLRGDPALAPDKMVYLLELYHELLVEYEEGVGDGEARAYLEGFPGGGRGAKLARAIVALV